MNTKVDTVQPLEPAVWALQSELWEVHQFIESDFHSRYGSWPADVAAQLLDYLAGLQLTLEEVIELLEPEEES